MGFPDTVEDPTHRLLGRHDPSGQLDGGNAVVVDQNVLARRVEPTSRIPQHQAIAKQRGGHEFLALPLSRALPRATHFGRPGNARGLTS